MAEKNENTMAADEVLRYELLESNGPKGAPTGEPVLSVRDLHVSFNTEAGVVHAVRGVNFDLWGGRTLGIVGESGSGKSVTALSLIGLLDDNAHVTGSIRLRGEELLGKTDEEMSEYRGTKISMIFQDPLSALTPMFSIGDQLAEALLIHNPGMRKADVRKRCIELLELVGITDPEDRLDAYPHEFSGGMRQRVVIAIAIANNPDIIIADEPTTALDVTIQAQILDLLRNLKDQINSSIMFITHDLGVIAEMADYVVVMYAGRIVEQGTAEEIFAHPAHPYTIGLMASKPVVGRQVEKLYSIPGKVPNPINMPNYCYFKDRCEMCVNGCEGDYPCEVSISPTHKVSCYRYYDGKRPDLEEIVEEELAEGKENGKEGE